MDTNVLIGAAFRPASHAGRVIAHLREGRLRLVWDAPTRAESESLIRRIPPLCWEDVADLFQEEDRFKGEVEETGFEGVPDADDRKFAALAAAAGATLVTLDAHLLEAGLEDVQVVTPRKLLSDTPPRRDQPLL